MEIHVDLTSDSFEFVETEKKPVRAKKVKQPLASVDSTSAEMNLGTEAVVEKKGKKSARKTKPALPTGIPSWMGEPGELSAEIRSRLGLAAVTFHPVPHAEWAGVGGFPSLEQSTLRRSEVWRSAAEGSGLIIVSMDPGTRNFALRVERRRLSGESETLYFRTIDVDPDAEARRSDETVPARLRRGTGKADENGEQCTHARLHSVFYSEPLRSWLEGAHIFMFEKQQHDNNLATRISIHAFTLVSALLSNQREFTCPLVMEVSAKLKNQVIEVDRGVALRHVPDIKCGERVAAPLVKGLTRHYLKKSGVESALRFLKASGDEKGYKTIAPVGRGEKRDACTKPDDLADTVLHIEAWRVLVGWSK